jgi:hypothetical protein
VIKNICCLWKIFWATKNIDRENGKKIAVRYSILLLSDIWGNRRRRNASLVPLLLSINIKYQDLTILRQIIPSVP